MKINIPKYEYEKKLISENYVEFPNETKYYFETGIRRSIRIVPKWTTWQKERENKEEEIWSYEVTIVQLSFICKLEHFSLSVSDIEGYEVLDKNNIKRSIIESFMENWLDQRTKEHFESDLQSAINKICEYNEI